jgi:Tetratricopeptide repeat
MTEGKFNIFKKTPAAALLLLLLALAAYAPIFASGFTYDGRLVVGDNPAVAAPGSWPLLFSEKYFDAFGEDSYRLVSTATYLMDARLYGISKAGFGFTNIFLHMLSAFALLIVLRRRMSGGAAFLASALFITHPAISEAVYCVGHRESILGGLFVFSCIAINDRVIQKQKYSGVVLYSVYALGLFAIESVILAPLYILAESVLRKNNRLKENLRRIAVLLILAGIFFALRPWLFVAPGKTVEWFGGSFAASATHGVGALFTYIRLLAMPVALRPDYGQSILSLHSFSFWAGLAIFGFAALVVISQRVNPWLKTLVAWIIISLAPFLHILTPFWISMAERYLYVAAACFSAILAYGLFFGFAKSKKSACVACAIIVVCFAAGTFHRGLSHANDLALWTGAVKTQPDSLVAQTNLAQAQLQSGDYEGRGKTLRRILLIDPGNENASINLANIFGQSGQSAKAMDVLEKAVEMHPESALALEALGIEYLKSGLYEKAPELFGRLREVDGGRLPAARSMSRLHFVRRNMPELISSLDECAALDPRDAMCRQISGVLLMESGQYELAQACFQTCARYAEDKALKRGCEANQDKAKKRMAQ